VVLLKKRREHTDITINAFKGVAQKLQEKGYFRKNICG
jgi:hypothetical protein